MNTNIRDQNWYGIILNISGKRHQINNINQIVSIGNKKISKVYVGDRMIYPNMGEPFCDPEWWGSPVEQTTKYCEGNINQYGMRLVYNRDAEIEQSLVYQIDRKAEEYPYPYFQCEIWFAIRGRYLKYLYYVPFIGYNDEIKVKGDIENAVDITEVATDNIVDADENNKLIAYKLPLTDDGETKYYYDKHPHINNLVDNNGELLFRNQTFGDDWHGGGGSKVWLQGIEGKKSDEERCEELKKYIDTGTRYTY